MFISIYIKAVIAMNLYVIESSSDDLEWIKVWFEHSKHLFPIMLHHSINDLITLYLSH